MAGDLSVNEGSPCPRRTAGHVSDSGRNVVKSDVGHVVTSLEDGSSG